MTRTKLRVFPAIPRNPNAAKHIDDLMRVARFSERNGLEGPCCLLEMTRWSSHGPWLSIFSRTRRRSHR